MKKRKNNIKERIAISEILLLIVAVFAIAWMVHTDSGVGIVSAAPGDPEGSVCLGTEYPTCNEENLGSRRCPLNGNFVQECQSSGWVTIETCSPDGKCQNCVCVSNQGDIGDSGDNNGNDGGEESGSVIGEAAVKVGTTIGAQALMESEPITKSKLKLKEAINNVFSKQSPAIQEPTPDKIEPIIEQAGGGSKLSNWWRSFSRGYGQNFGLKGSGTPLNPGQVIGNIVTNAAIAVGVALLVTNLANKYSSQRNAGDISTVAWTSAGIGIAATSIWSIIGASAGAGPPGWIAGAVTLLAVGVYMLVGYQLYSQQVFSYQASLWQPPVGGNECERCNDLEIAEQEVCSEYICHTYGTTCEWVNDETEYEACVEVVQDRVAPRISPLTEAYDESVFNPPENYNYEISSAGARIIYNENNGCVPAFTPIMIAFETNERAHCKIDIVPHDADELSDEEIFGNMMDLAEGSVYGYTHTIELPSAVSASENALQAAGYGLSNGGIHEFYVRCVDLGGTYNDNDYSIAFCVDTGPDLSPPEITGTNPEEGSYIANGVETLENFVVFTNEPAICRWGFQPTAYGYMPYAFDRCSTNLNDPILNGGYEFGCTGEITGINPGQENTFYIACIDQPELIGTPREHERNTGDPYEVVLMGSEPLEIDAVAVNNRENNSIVSDNTETVDILLEVATINGADNGDSKCRYSKDLEEPRNYNPFYNEGTMDYISMNSQPLYLAPGNYKYNVECEDIAGNLATTMINFSVETDLEPPQIVRVYKDGNDLVIITDEQADCVYNLFTCDYDIETEGNSLSSGDGTIHTVEWDSENDFYIKCMDGSGITPLPNECSLIARPFEIHDIQDFE